MKDFMLIYMGGDPNWAQNATPEEIHAVMQAWGSWAQELAAADRLRSAGSALVAGGSLVTADGADVNTDAAMVEFKELVGGFSIIGAEDLADANRVAATGPFLKNNPGGTIIVRPCFAPPQPDA